MDMLTISELPSKEDGAFDSATGTSDMTRGIEET